MGKAYSIIHPLQMFPVTDEQALMREKKYPSPTDWCIKKLKKVYTIKFQKNKAQLS